jgi:RNA methyltransferase, TrmH family
MLGQMTGAPNSSVKRYRELARNAPQNGLEREILLDGLHLLFEAQSSGIAIDDAAFEAAAFGDVSVRFLAEQLAAAGADVRIVSRDVLEAMSPVKTPSGAVAIARLSLASLASVVSAGAERAALVVVAQGVQDPGNVGGIMRTAEAAGATGFVASSGTADPVGWKALRGSMGSGLRLPVARAEFDATIDECRKAGLATAALVPRGGEPFFDADLRAPTALLLGGEGPGLPEHVLQQADRQLSVPMQAPVESLNVGVAAALVLYEAFRQRRADRSKPPRSR